MSIATCYTINVNCSYFLLTFQRLFSYKSIKALFLTSIILFYCRYMIFTMPDHCYKMALTSPLKTPISTSDVLLYTNFPINFPIPTIPDHFYKTASTSFKVPILIRYYFPLFI